MMESSKRAKALGSTSQNVQCLVDGCNADLTQCRDYHRRHKVCEFHSKSPTVTIGGREQRFCQQCSRFHSLVEFDDVKRSCRKRLDGHNRRRRKPQPELRNAGLVLPGQQGGSRLLSFTTPQMCSTPVSSSWTSIVEPKNDFALYNNQLNWNSAANTCPESSSAHGYKGVNHLEFMQNAQHSASQPLLESGSRCGGHTITNSGQKIFSDGGLNNQVIHCDSALSLLSSRSTPAITREVGYNSMVHHPDSMSSQSQTAHGSRFSGGPGRFLFPPDVEHKPAVSETGSHVSSNATFQFQEMFQNGPDESSASASHQTLTFLWE